MRLGHAPYYSAWAVLPTLGTSRHHFYLGWAILSPRWTYQRRPGTPRVSLGRSRTFVGRAGESNGLPPILQRPQIAPESPNPALPSPKPPPLTSQGPPKNAQEMPHLVLQNVHRGGINLQNQVRHCSGVRHTAYLSVSQRISACLSIVMRDTLRYGRDTFEIRLRYAYLNVS